MCFRHRRPGRSPGGCCCGLRPAKTEPATPPVCVLVQGGLACGAGAENVPFELAAHRAQTEDQLRERFVKAKAEGDLGAGSEPAALARYLSVVTAGMGVLASSGADRDALREVALVSLKAFDEQMSVGKRKSKR